MSNRTSEANKAIARAWSKEQQRILEGKGTRDWTPEQQQDILDRGKAYGDDGKAFEGHHMKSAEKFPEYQGDSENIQFLSRSEHCAAHYGNFQNSTNGFFNPATNETKDFGLNKYESCETFELNNSIISTGNQAQNTTANTGASAKSSVGDAKATTLSGSSPPTTSGFIGTGKRLAGKTVEFCVRHKKVIGAVASAAATIAAAAAIKEILDRNSKSSSSDYTADDDYTTSSLTTNISEDIIERASPSEHSVSAHRQRYNGEWKDKESYMRNKTSND